LALASGSKGSYLLAAAKQGDQGDNELRYTDYGVEVCHGETFLSPSVKEMKVGKPKITIKMPTITKELA
jgi:hypothetical protein